MTNYINKYYNAIKSGKITVGRSIVEIYSYVVDGIENNLFRYDAEKAQRAISFIENFCRHHEGALAPNLIKLELWQKAFISCLFGVVDHDGNRQFREVVLIIARKNGKTLLAAAIACYCAFLDGEYGGRIYFCAPRLEQANLCYDATYQMISKDAELSAITKKRRTDLYISVNNTTIKPLPFSSKKSDGLNCSVVIGDEFASWAGDAGLKFAEVLKSSFGARKQPIMLYISTASYVSDSVYDELMKRCTRFLKGDSRETRLLPVLYMIDDVSKWNDIKELKKSNPNLDVSVSSDYMREEIAIAENSISKRNEFLTKYCNIKQNSAVAWLRSDDVEKCFGDVVTLDDLRGCYCVGGIDLSQTTDLTAACILVEKYGKLYNITQFFLPAERIEQAQERDGIPYNIYLQRGFLKRSGDNFIDYNDCFDWFKMLVEQYEIYPLKIGYDRYSAQYLVQDMERYGFHMSSCYQGDNLYPCINELEGHICDGNINFGDNSLMKMHLLDSAVKMSEERGRGRLVKIRVNGHIDGTAALLDAFAVRQLFYNEIGEQLKNED